MWYSDITCVNIVLHVEIFQFLSTLCTLNLLLSCLVICTMCQDAHTACTHTRMHMHMHTCAQVQVHALQQILDSYPNQIEYLSI